MLGFRTEQLSWNKLSEMIDLGYFSNPPAQRGFRFYPKLHDQSADLESKVRAYLAVDCSTCHNPSGMAPGGMDMRFSVTNDKMNMIDVFPYFDSLGIADPRRIKAGKKEDSVAWERMRVRGVTLRCPRVFSHKIDDDAIDLVGRWIDQLKVEQ